MPITSASLTELQKKQNPRSPLIELPVMQLTTRAVQLLWEGASVAADSECVWGCVGVCTCPRLCWPWPTHAAEFVSACFRIKSHPQTYLISEGQLTIAAPSKYSWTYGLCALCCKYSWGPVCFTWPCVCSHANQAEKTLRFDFPRLWFHWLSMFCKRQRLIIVLKC